MAEKRLDIVVGARDATQGGIRDALQSLKKSFGEDSALGGLAKLTVGAGAIAGVAVLARGLEQATGRAAELSQQLASGQLSMEDVNSELLKSIPILGSVAQAGENIGKVWAAIEFGDYEGLGKAQQAATDIVAKLAMQRTLAEATSEFDRRRLRAAQEYAGVLSEINAIQRAAPGSAEFLRRAESDADAIRRATLAQVAADEAKERQRQAEEEQKLAADNEKERQRLADEEKRRLEQEQRDRINAFNERLEAELRVAGVISEARQKQAQAEGRDFDARLEALRSHYAERIRLAREAMEAEALQQAAAADIRLLLQQKADALKAGGVLPQSRGVEAELTGARFRGLAAAFASQEQRKVIVADPERKADAEKAQRVLEQLRDIMRLWLQERPQRGLVVNL